MLTSGASIPVGHGDVVKLVWDANGYSLQIQSYLQFSKAMNLMHPMYAACQTPTGKSMSGGVERHHEMH